MYISRAEWGARSPAYPVTKVGYKAYTCMHHAAEKNRVWTMEEMKAKVRSYQNYHIDALGGADLFYAELCFPDGTVFEGREGGIWVNNGGAYGANKVAWGYCLVGNFNEQLPSQAQSDYAKVKSLQIHHLCNIPWDKALGHRDFWFLDSRNAGNDCPGQYAYINTLPEVREFIKTGGGPQMVSLPPLHAVRKDDRIEAFGTIITPPVDSQDAYFRIPFRGFTATPEYIGLTWGSGKNRWAEGPVKFDESKDGVSFYVRDTGTYKIAAGSIAVYAIQRL